MLVGGVLSLVPMSDFYLRSAQGPRIYSWTGVPMSASCRLCGAQDAHVGRVMPHGPASDSRLCSAQGARGCSWMGCCPMGA